MATAAKTSLLKSGFVNWFLDPKITTFFPKQHFFFQTQGYQNRWPIETLKKAGTKLFSWFKLGHKNKSKFHSISICHTFTRSEKLLDKFQDFFKNSRLCANPENEFAFFQTLVHLFLFDENVECWYISLELISWGQYSERKNCCCLFISPRTHEIRHFHIAVKNWLIKTVYLSKPIAFLMFSMWWSSSLLKLPDYWKISVPFLSQGISQACLSGRFFLQRWSI